jgi:malate synthase
VAFILKYFLFFISGAVVVIQEDAAPVHVHNAKKIKRKHGGIVVLEPKTKEYKVVLKSAGL